MDQRSQIWKCTGEHNPNQTNWSFQKVSGFTENKFKSFFHDAMSFDDYYLISDISKIKSLPILRLDNGPSTEYLFGFNGTATKAVMVQ